MTFVTGFFERILEDGRHADPEEWTVNVERIDAIAWLESTAVVAIGEEVLVTGEAETIAWLASVVRRPTRWVAKPEANDAD